MSAEAVKQILTRAVREPVYRHLLFRQPDQAMAAYALTSVEQAMLTSLPAEGFDDLAASLESRVSLAAVPLDASASGAKQLDSLTQGGGPTAAQNQKIQELTFN